MPLAHHAGGVAGFGQPRRQGLDVQRQRSFAIGVQADHEELMGLLAGGSVGDHPGVARAVLADAIFLVAARVVLHLEHDAGRAGRHEARDVDVPEFVEKVRGNELGGVEVVEDSGLLAGRQPERGQGDRDDLRGENQHRALLRLSPLGRRGRTQRRAVGGLLGKMGAIDRQYRPNVEMIKISPQMAGALAPQ